MPPATWHGKLALALLLMKEILHGDPRLSFSQVTSLIFHGLKYIPGIFFEFLPSMLSAHFREV